MQFFAGQVFVIFAFTIFGRTYPTRLSVRGVMDEWVTQLLRQGYAKVFKKYSQMKREALAKLNRRAGESGSSFGTKEEKDGKSGEQGVNQPVWNQRELVGAGRFERPPPAQGIKTQCDEELRSSTK